MKNKSVGRVILNTIKEKWLLTAGIVINVVGAIVTALFPPLILAKIIDTITSGTMPAFYMIIMYFGFLLITGLMESARETFLTVFGQKITHSLRSALMYKYSCLTTSGLTSLELLFQDLLVMLIQLRICLHQELSVCLLMPVR